MELVVVLAILAAVAAIVVPLFPNLLRRAHKATDCTQTNEMAKSVQLFNTLYFSYPDGFDTLVDTTGATPGYLPGATSTVGAFGGFTTTHQLTADEASAMTTVGLRNLYNNAATGATNALFHPTMWPYVDAPVAVPVASGLTVRILDNTAINNPTTGNPRFLANVRTDPTAAFIVFGIGPKCAMIGRNIQDAPTSVPQKSDFTPDNTYSRVGVVFQIAGTAVSAGDNRAIFVCSCALEDDELESTEKDIIGYYQVSRDTR